MSHKSRFLVPSCHHNKLAITSLNKLRYAWMLSLISHITILRLLTITMMITQLSVTIVN